MKVLVKIIDFLGTEKVLSLIIELVEILVKRSDNKVDDRALQTIKEVLEDTHTSL